jgi:hypothetical protein
MDSEGSRDKANIVGTTNCTYIILSVIVFLGQSMCTFIYNQNARDILNTELMTNR